MIKALVPTHADDGLRPRDADCSAPWASAPTRRSPISGPGAARCAIADGPDEVHLRAIARMEIKEARERLGATAAYLTPPPRV